MTAVFEWFDAMPLVFCVCFCNRSYCKFSWRVDIAVSVPIHVFLGYLMIVLNDKHVEFMVNKNNQNENNM